MYLFAIIYHELIVMLCLKKFKFKLFKEIIFCLHLIHVSTTKNTVDSESI